MRRPELSYSSSILLTDIRKGEALISSSYWSLLSDILDTESALSERLWLTTLLSRISISNIATLFLKGISEDTIVNDPLLMSFSMKCFSTLWPISVARMGLDSLTDCFCSVLSFLATLETLQNVPTSTLELLLLVSRSFRHSLGTAANKKRVRLTIA